MATITAPADPTMIAISQKNDNRLLNEIVEAFETLRAQDAETQIDSFLPDQQDPEYGRIALELMRVDMEHSWRDGEPKSLDEYKSRFTDVLSDHAAFRELAYEDYRQRLLRGETIRRDDYQKFGIDTNGWPTSDGHDQEDASEFGTVENLSGEFARLVESLQEYPVAGQSFGPYDIVQQIGRGAFARVYLARQRELANRLVVLKVGSPTSTEHERLARLQHTNIVPIHSVHDVGSVSVICMPFFGMSTLADVIQFLRRSELPPNSADMIPRALADKRTAGPACTTGPASASAFAIPSDHTYEAACVSVMRRIAEAMAHAHGRGILHRDLKPANILLSDDGQPMLLDFNVSGEVVPGGVSCLTVGGTLPYMSPEQLRSVRTGDANDARSDIYSFGLVCYELLSGVLPFSMHQMGAASTVRPTPEDVTSPDRPVASVADSIDRVLVERESTTPNVRKDSRHISQGLANIVAKCLRPDPVNRYSTAEELCEDLRRHEGNLPLLYASRAPMRERFSKWVRRHPKLTSATAVSTAAVVMLSAAVMFAFIKAREVSQRDATITAGSIHRAIPRLRAMVTNPTRSSEILTEGRSLAEALLKTANDLESPNHLNDDTLRKFRSDVTELNFLINHSKAVLDGEPQIDRDAFRLTTTKTEQPEILAALSDVLSGRAAAAVATFEQAVRREPLSFSHRLVLANVYVAAGQLQKADEAYTVCVSIEPDSFLAVFNRGLCRLEMARYSDAAADFSTAVRLRPASAEAWINRGLVRKEQNDYENAEGDLSAAIQLKPEWPRPYFIRSRIRKALKDNNGAQSDIAAGLQLTPLTENDWIARGLAQLKSDPNAAYVSFEQALRLNPFSRSALRNMAHVVSEHRRNTDAALEMLDRVVEISPGYLDDVVSRAVLNARSGKEDEATAEIERVLALRRDGKTVIQAACVYALLAAEYNDESNGRTKKTSYEKRAIALVAEAITIDAKWLSIAARDPDLASIRHLRDFKSIVTAAARLQRAVRNAKHELDTE